MRIGVHARILATDQLRGWSRYTSNLVQGLLTSENEIFLLSDIPINESLIAGEKRPQVVIRPTSSYFVWEQMALPALCRELKLDVLHCPINFGLPYFLNIPKVLTMHDAIERTSFGTTWKTLFMLSGLKNRLYHRLAIHGADRIITVSQHARADISQRYGISPEKIEVIYEGADRHFHTSRIEPAKDVLSRFKIRGPYFFYVGGFDERKNIEFLLSAWAEAQIHGFQLVLGGGEGAARAVLSDKVRQLKIEDQVVFTGYIPDDVLPSVYAHAQCFVYPSLYEGFGLQIVESLQMETPVICSNVTSLPEILGDEECTFDPLDQQSLVKLLRKMCDVEFRNRKGAEVKLQRNRFSQDEMLRKTLLLFENLVISRKGHL